MPNMRAGQGDRPFMPSVCQTDCGWDSYDKETVTKVLQGIVSRVVTDIEATPTRRQPGVEGPELMTNPAVGHALEELGRAIPEAPVRL
jgi:hypothetical protein